MHNLHLVRVKANSGQEACKEVESAIIDFGNENNWRCICGAVSEDNEVYDAGEGRYRPAENYLTSIELINEAVNRWIGDCFYGSVAKEKLNKNETDLNEWNAHELWSLSKYAEHLSEAHSYKDKAFNVLEDIFFSYKYDECGVTDLEWSVGDGDKHWIVFVDMHS
jgi:hypothetical protein